MAEKKFLDENGVAYLYKIVKAQLDVKAAQSDLVIIENKVNELDNDLKSYRPLSDTEIDTIINNISIASADEGLN